MANAKYVPGEEIIFEIRPSWFILAIQILPMIIGVAGILGIFAFTGLFNIWLYIVVLLVGIFVAFVIFLNWYFTIYRLTNKRVENQSGIFGRREEEIALQDVQAVDNERTFWGRIFGYGTVIIKAAGQFREVDFTNISQSKKVADQIEDMAISVRNGLNNT
jgi:uncharacterized membrane protein YdbT with pleckstrin-like domain